MIKLTKSTRSVRGSCRGCHSKDDEVFVISAGEGLHVTSIQVCYSCLTDLVGQVPRRKGGGDGDVAFDRGAVIEDCLEGLERQFVSWWHKASQDESEARERGELEVASAYNTFAAAYSTCGARVAEVRRAILKAKTPRE